MTLFNARDCLLADVLDEEESPPDAGASEADIDGDDGDDPQADAAYESEIADEVESSDLPMPGEVFEVADDEADSTLLMIDPALVSDDADATDVADMTAEIEWPELKLPDLGFEANDPLDDTEPPHSAAPLSMSEPVMEASVETTPASDLAAEAERGETEDEPRDALEAAPASAMPEALPVEDLLAAPDPVGVAQAPIVDEDELDPVLAAALEGGVETSAPPEPVALGNINADALSEPADTTDADTADEVPLPHLMREELAQQDQQAVPTAPRKPWIWALGALLLLMIISTQLVFWQRDYLAATPATRGLAERLCQIFNCELSPLRDVQRIELLQRSVYSHPNVSGALIISVSMVNNATYDQPYPTLAIRMADVRGRAVAARNFRPEDYLQAASAPAGMPAGLPVTVTLEVFDPGRDALTFELDFL